MERMLYHTKSLNSCFLSRLECTPCPSPLWDLLLTQWRVIPAAEFSQPSAP